LHDTDRAGHPSAMVRAVSIRVLGIRQVLLVVVLGEVELGRLADLGRDLAIAGPRQLLLVGRQRLLGCGLLLWRVPEDRGTVLATDVVTLAHALGRVVRLPEHLQ